MRSFLAKSQIVLIVGEIRIYDGEREFFQKKKNSSFWQPSLQKWRGRKLCQWLPTILLVLQSEGYGLDNLTLIEDIDNDFWREIERSFCIRKLSQNTICSVNTRYQNFFNGFFMPIIRPECAQHRNCSELFHSCLQRNIGSCRSCKTHDG